MRDWYKSHCEYAREEGVAPLSREEFQKQLDEVNNFFENATVFEAKGTMSEICEQYRNQH